MQQLPTDPPAPLARSSNSIVLRGLLDILWRRKLCLVIGLLLGAAAGAGLYFVLPIAYSSSAQILIVKKRPEGVVIDSNQPFAEDFVATHQGLIKSPLIMDRAIKVGRLNERDDFRNDDKLTQTLLKRLTVSRNKDSMGTATSIITLSYRGSTPDDCNAVLNAVIEAYRSSLDEFFARDSGSTIELLRKAREQSHDDLAKKEENYRKFREESPFIWKGRDGVNLRQERLVSLETKRSAVMLRQAEVNGQLLSLEKAIDSKADREILLAMVAETGPGRDGDVPRAGPTGRWQEQVLLLLQQEQKLLERLGPDHPEVKSLQQQLTTARDFLVKPSAPFGKDTSRDHDPVRWRLQSLRQEADILNITEKFLADLSKVEQDEIRKASGWEVRDETLRNEITRNQQLFETTLKRLQDANIHKDTGGYESRVIAPPGSGGVPKVQPSGLILGSFAIALGMLLAAGLAGLAEWRDPGFSSLDDIRNTLGVSLIGQIPRMGGRSKLVSPLPTLNEDRGGPIAEPLRALRNAVTAILRDDSQKCILVVSPKAGDGKTFIASNLAILIAQSGRRVLLIDGNLRDPRIGAVFGLTPRPGLASLLRGDISMGQAIVEGPVPGLSLLPTEAARQSAPDLISTPSFANALNEFRSRFDLVLIDSPALLSVADGSALAILADGAMLVLPEHRAIRADAEQLIAGLATTQTPILGVVANWTDRPGLFPGLRATPSVAADRTT